MMTTEQYFELSAQDRQYWSAENRMNRLTDTATEDLSWENKALTKSLYLERVRVHELTEQLAAAEEKIRELTGQPEPEGEEISLVKQYCGIDTSLHDRYAEREEDENDLTDWEKIVRNCRIYDMENKSDYTTDEDDNDVTTWEKILINSGRTDRESHHHIQDGYDNNSFFGTLPTDGEALEPE